MGLPDGGGVSGLRVDTAPPADFPVPPFLTSSHQGLPPHPATPPQTVCYHFPLGVWPQ